MSLHDDHDDNELNQSTDEQIQNILNNYEIQSYFKKFPNYQPRLHECIKGIMTEGPADLDIRIEAIKKAFKAITGKLSIFLSYKRDEHADAAESLEEILKICGH